MDTLQIERILKNDFCTKKIFKGVYPKNRLPIVEYPGSYVVNTNPSTAPGEHWVAVFFNNKGSCKISWCPVNLFIIDALVTFIAFSFHVL